MGSCFAEESLLHTVVFSIRGESFQVCSDYPWFDFHLICSGDRPLSSCLGGGDLDGDVYNLIPLNDLPEFHPKTLSTPAQYNAAPKKLLDRPSTMDDVAEFIVDYINSDVSGCAVLGETLITDI